MLKFHRLKRIAAAALAAILMASLPGAVMAAEASADTKPVRTLTMDTRSYVMAPGNIYDFRAKVEGPGLSQSNVEVFSSRDGIASVARVPGTDKYRVTGRKEGITYVVSQINGVHASIKVEVKNSVSQHGEACRSVSIVGYTDAEETLSPVELDGEMRAVWVPFMTLDMSRDADQSQAAFEKKYDSIVAEAKEAGMNAMIVHVRPFGDSFYPSDYFPWSHLLTGTQGKNPGYDPLKYMVEATHKAGMEFHAWVNPLRIQITGYPPEISADNVYSKWIDDASKPNWTMNFEGKKYFNPGVAQVRAYIANGVKEIVEKYDVDGVQFDDYFYPTQGSAIDSVSYQNSGSSLSLLDWRTQNINLLVSEVYKAVKSAKSDVVFGISPQGNIQNDLNMGADVYTWGSQAGYVDYICPQIYVTFGHKTLPFAKTAQTWRSLVTNSSVKLYLGLGLYKAGTSADSGTWQTSDSNIAQQIQLGRSIKADGFMLYSWAYLDNIQTKAEMENVKSLLQ